MMQRLFKSIIELIPEEDPNENIVKQVSDDKTYHRIWSKNTASFMGIPIAEILPRCILENKVINDAEKLFTSQFSRLAESSKQSFEMRSVLSKKIADYSKLYCYAGKKTIRSEDIRLMLNVFSRSLDKADIKTIAKLTRSMYASINNEMERMQNSGEISLPYRNPSLAPGKDDIYPHGQGSYGQSSTWLYGKQSHIDYSNLLASSTGEAIHPFVLVKMSFEKDNTSRTTIRCEFIDESFTIDGDGYMTSESSSTLSYAWQDYIEEKLAQPWSVMKYDSGYHVKKTQIIHPTTGIVWFSAEEKTSNYSKSAVVIDTEYKMEIFLGKRKKIGEIKYFSKSNNNDEESTQRFLEFLGKYIASEIACYAYASCLALSIPHCCEVPPNGNPWLAFRLSGKLSAVPSISMGQSAYPENYLWLASDAEDKSQYRSAQRADWTSFYQEIKEIIVKESVTRYTHDAFNYHVDVTRLPRDLGATISLFSDSFNFIDEIRVAPSDLDRLSIAGRVALAHALGILNTPTYADIDCPPLPVPVRSSTDSKPAKPVISFGSEESVFESMPHSIISYHVNSSSTVIYKTSDMSQIRGNITNSVDMFDAPTIDQNNLSSFVSWGDFSIFCQDHFQQNFNEQFMNLPHAYFTPLSLERFNDAIQKNFYVHEINNLGLESIPEVKQKNENTFVSLQPKTLITTPPLSNGLSYIVRLIRFISHKSVLESMGPVQKTIFNSLFSFYIVCTNSNGQEICIYQPSFMIKAGNYPRYASLSDIMCGYLPDFMCWMSNEGLRSHKASQVSSASYAQLAENHRITTKTAAKDEEMPFSPDASMGDLQKEIVRKWLAYHFPSLALINQGIGKRNMTILDHLMESTLAVDRTRGKEDYSPAKHINDESVTRLLRLAMLLHDVGKSFPSDGGVGPSASNHPAYSAALARKLLSQFFLKNNEIEMIEKWIYYHDVFEKASRGTYGSLNESGLHIAKIAETIDDAEILYHIYRCDTDFLRNYRKKDSKEKENAEDWLDPEDILDSVVQYIKSGSFPKIKGEKKSISRSFDAIGFFWANMDSLSTNGEKVIRKQSIANDYLVASRPMNKTVFSPEYLVKAESIIKEINKNTHLSFARALDMSYDGNTGRIARCFHWVNMDSVQTIFLEGMMPYASIDGRSIYASINSASPLPVPLYNDDYVALIVFDYHCGDMISKSELEKISKDYVSWKKNKLGTSIFSLTRDENDLIDNARIGLDLGYASSLDVHAKKKILCCFDPARIALITAMAVPMKVATRDLSPDFKGNPLHFFSRSHTGFFRKVQLPELSYADLKIEEKNDLWLGGINE